MGVHFIEGSPSRFAARLNSGVVLNAPRLGYAGGRFKPSQVLLPTGIAERPLLAVSRPWPRSSPAPRSAWSGIGDPPHRHPHPVPTPAPRRLQRTRCRPVYRLGRGRAHTMETVPPTCAALGSAAGELPSARSARGHGFACGFLGRPELTAFGAGGVLARAADGCGQVCVAYGDRDASGD